jgi:SanA protein
MTKITKFALPILIALAVFALIAVYCDVRSQAGPIYYKIADVPKMPVAIVFGAGIGTSVLKDRVQTAVSLYKSGKVQKILMTGDNSHLDYDEPEAMKALAVGAGIPKIDIACDYAGFRTYDSLYRARHIFDVHQAVLITQAFHLPRAMFIAKHLGLSSVGVDASLRSYGLDQYWYELREVFATECAWLDVFLQRKPKFLGKKESLDAHIKQQGVKIANANFT